MCPAGIDIGLYTGNVNVTDSGRACMKWNNADIAGSKANHNFCRNLVNKFPFCKTTDGRIEYCTEAICKGKLNEHHFIHRNFWSLWCLGLG